MNKNPTPASLAGNLWSIGTSLKAFRRSFNVPPDLDAQLAKLSSRIYKVGSALYGRPTGPRQDDFASHAKHLWALYKTLPTVAAHPAAPAGLQERLLDLAQDVKQIAEVLYGWAAETA